MNAFLAAYLSLHYIPTGSGPQLLPGYHHSPMPIAATVATRACQTGWGERYPVGEQMLLGGLMLRCDYVATWHDGEYEGNSVRWTVSSL
tara:strand:+ start:296 stop:562 length:267 start_codon:yes stop_codon:yes gene_type:complete